MPERPSDCTLCVCVCVLSMVFISRECSKKTVLRRTSRGQITRRTRVIENRMEANRVYLGRDLNLFLLCREYLSTALIRG